MLIIPKCFVLAALMQLLIIHPVYAGNILVSGNVSNHKKMLKLLKPALK